MRRNYEIQQNFEIDAEPAVCYAVISDIERYPEWFTFVKEANVRDRTVRGRPQQVHFVFDIPPKSGFTIVQHFEYDEEQLFMRFSAVGGQFRDAEGSFKFTRLLTGRTEVKWYFRINPGVIIPIKLLNYLIDRVLREFFRMFKEEAEARGKTPRRNPGSARG